MIVLPSFLLCGCKSGEDVVSYEMNVFIKLDFSDEIEYHLLDAKEKNKYNIPPDYEKNGIAEEDIGDYIGLINNVRNGSVKEAPGGKAYHYSKYPENDAIIIAEFNRNLCFFCTYGYYVDIPEGDYSDLFIEKYNLPQSINRIIFTDEDGTLLKTIPGKEKTQQIVDVLSRCVNIGLKEQNQRLAALWYKRYRNNLVRIDDNSGYIIYGSSEDTETFFESSSKNTQNEAETECDSNSIFSLIESAHSLWSEGAFNMIIETKEGYEIHIAYSPQGQCFSAFSGVFDLSEEKIEILNKLYKETNND